jgi:hypothetical protein
MILRFAGPDGADGRGPGTADGVGHGTAGALASAADAEGEVDGEVDGEAAPAGTEPAGVVPVDAEPVEDAAPHAVSAATAAIPASTGTVRVVRWYRLMSASLPPGSWRGGYGDRARLCLLRHG